MFHWDDGLFLNRPRLAIDVRRRQQLAFVSHAHADHIAPHVRAYCTKETALLYRHRLGSHRTVMTMGYGEPIALGEARLTALPAGHCLGSAMLYVESAAGTLLYTGDFKLGRSETAVEARVPTADVLIMESTFGLPHYRLPPRDEVVEELIALVKETLQAGRTPVLHAYALGKSQEVTRLLTKAGVSVLQHADVYAVSQIYLQCGVDLGDVRPFDPRLVEGRAVVTLPKRAAKFRLPGIKDPVSIAVTGWAADPSTKYRWNVDHAAPLSDHADFDQLVETAKRVRARQIYCMHGPREFVDHLNERGFSARPIYGSYQSRLF